MPLSDLIARLEQEAQTQIDAADRDADARIRAIDASAESAIADATARHLEQERVRRQIEHEQELARAQRTARARELEARREQITGVLSRARTQAREFAATQAYRDAVPRHLEEALSFLEGLPTRVHCQAVFVPMVEPVLARHAGAQLVIDESIEPGVVAEAADGSVVVDNTLTSRLARAETTLTIELAKRLDDVAR